MDIFSTLQVLQNSIKKLICNSIDLNVARNEKTKYERSEKQKKLNKRINIKIIHTFFNMLLFYAKCLTKNNKKKLQ